MNDGALTQELIDAIVPTLFYPKPNSDTVTLHHVEDFDSLQDAASVDVTDIMKKIASTTNLVAYDCHTGRNIIIHSFDAALALRFNDEQHVWLLLCSGDTQRVVCHATFTSIESLTHPSNPSVSFNFDTWHLESRSGPVAAMFYNACTHALRKDLSEFVSDLSGLVGEWDLL